MELNEIIIDFFDGNGNYNDYVELKLIVIGICGAKWNNDRIIYEASGNKIMIWQGWNW